MDECVVRGQSGRAIEVALFDDGVWFECTAPHGYGADYCNLPLEQARMLRDWLNENVKG